MIEQINVTITITINAGQIWAAINSIGRLDRWFPIIATCYLFRFDDLAAKLGEQYGTDWIIADQHSKPSFLYSYLIAHVINAKTQTLAVTYAIELKGNHEKVTQRGVKSLAMKINTLINK
ncbi:MAG TPA: DUF2380 domain-containing protein [Methylococcales bacterium]